MKFPKQYKKFLISTEIGKKKDGQKRKHKILSDLFSVVSAQNPKDVIETDNNI